MPEKQRPEGESLGAVKQRPRGGVSAPEKRRPPPEVSTPATYKLFFSHLATGPLFSLFSKHNKPRGQSKPTAISFFSCRISKPLPHAPSRLEKGI